MDPATFTNYGNLADMMISKDVIFDKKCRECVLFHLVMVAVCNTIMKYKKVSMILYVAMIIQKYHSKDILEAKLQKSNRHLK